MSGSVNFGGEITVVNLDDKPDIVVIGLPGMDGRVGATGPMGPPGMPGANASSSGHVIQEEDTTLTQRTKLSFVGANVTATDDPANDRTIVTITGGSMGRQSSGVITNAIADQENATGVINLGKSYRIIRIMTDRPCRVRLYTTDAKRDADISRAAGTLPLDDHGLVMDFITTPGDLDWDTSPTIDGSDGKPTPNGLIPYTITNLSGSTSSVEVTLHWLATE